MVHRGGPPVARLVFHRPARGGDGRKVAVDSELQIGTIFQLGEGRHRVNLGRRLDVLEITAERPSAARRIFEVQRDIAGPFRVVADPGVGVVVGVGHDARNKDVVFVIRIGRVRRQDALAAHRVFDVIGLGLRTQRLQGEQPLVIRAPLRRQRDRRALLFPVDGAPAHILGNINRFVGLARAVSAVGRQDHRVITVGRDAVGAVADVGDADVGQEAELAETGIPTIGTDHATGPEALLGQVAVVVVGVDRQQAVGVVERHAGAQVDRAGDAALDHVGGDVLIDVHARQQVGRDILEAETAARGGGEDVATVGFGTHARQAAHEDAAAFGRQTGGVAGGVGALQGDAGNALQRLRHRTVRQGADVHGGHRIDDDLGILLDGLGRAKLGANAGDDHFIDRGGVVRLGRILLGERARRQRCGHRKQGRSTQQSDTTHVILTRHVSQNLPAGRARRLLATWDDIPPEVKPRIIRCHRYLSRMHNFSCVEKHFLIALPRWRPDRIRLGFRQA